MTDWDGADYQRRIEKTLADRDPHGEVVFVQRYGPRTVLDAGCGTGRVAIELADRGVDVVGVDVNASMLEVAKQRAPDLPWVLADLAALDLGRAFDVVVLAGNVPLFTPPGTTAALIAGCARHLAPDAVLVAGFALDGRYTIGQYDAECEAVGLILHERYATWDREPFASGDYAVSVHRPRGRTGQVPSAATPVA
ncbi:trans-aconitate 2-methyltransferase [Egicoccus sp. AB-alg6-2]|uniref:class I SAM-dependent methyltransferase n=1 Tax=Egicoccus sp. AB-alg6-2 TaxID=3242692 RepID=UPI00359E4F87